MLSELRRSNEVRKIIEEMDKVAKSLISLAYAAVPATRESMPTCHYLASFKNHFLLL